ncbi:MAG: PAS domain S-box protein [Nitrospirota bacterium]
MKEDKRIKELQKEREYLSDRLEEAAKELAKLDLLNLTLTQQKRQAVAAFNFINVMQEKIEKALTIDDLYSNIVKALTTDLFMDSSALLRIDFNTKDIFILASSGLTENLKYLKLDENISKKEVLNPTFVNSKSSLHAFHTFVVKSFEFPFFIWHPIVDEEDGLIVLFVGNRFEDLVSKQPFSDANFETFRAISSVISLRRDNIVKTQEMLRRKREKIDFLAEVLKASPIAVIATDIDGRMTYVNPATEELYGYREEDLVGKDPGMLNADPNAGEIQKEIVDTVRQEKIWRGELLNKKKNGDLFYIHASIYPVLDKKGNFIAFVGFQEDITERKKTEKALWESEKKYRNLVNNALVGIYKTNLKGDILFVNEALSKMLEFGSPEDMMAEGASARYKNPKDREVLNEKLRKMNRVESFEIELLTKTGKTKDVLLSATLEGDMISGMIMDITMRKHLCEQVQVSQGHLQSLSRRLMEVQESERRFLASELHDQIGQNLTALSINLNVIRSRFSEEVDIKIVDRLEDSLRLVEETIQRVRSVMAGLRPPVLDDYGLAVALRWYTERFSERNAVVTVVQEKEFLSCLPLTVETALFRIVQEVLTNVSKHANAKHVIITLERIDGVVQLVVSDDGVGFDPSVPRKLKKQPGWGLRTIEERAKAMGGNVYVKSAPGKGTRIIVQVPC